MRIKKKKVEDPTPDKILEERVDAMMDPKRPESSLDTPKPDEDEADDGTLPPLDIFAGAATAPPVPTDLASEIPEEQEEPEAPVNTVSDTDASSTGAVEDVPPEPQLDDAVSDAAVDDIVAHESDTVLAAEDAAIRSQSVHAPRAKKIHRHPVFWTLITLVVIVAVTMALLLVSGGNWHLPGPLQSAKNALSK